MTDATLISELMERQVAAHLDARGEDLSSRAARITLATNSRLIERRGRPLIALACAELGRPGLAGTAVVDLGCGFGALSLLLAADGATVVGIDAAEQRLAVGRQIAAASGLAVTFRAGRMEHPPLAHAAADLVLVNNSLCYVTDPEARRRVLEQAYRALAPGGVIIVRDPNRLRARDRFTGRWLVGLLGPRAAAAAARVLGARRSLVRLRTPWGARRELSAAGFSGARVATAGGPLRRALAGYNVLVASRPPS